MENYFSSNLKYFRESQNLDQNDLAEIFNVDRTTVTKWENGSRNPTTEKMIEITDFFGVNINDFIRKNLYGVNIIEYKQNLEYRNNFDFMLNNPNVRILFDKKNEPISPEDAVKMAEIIRKVHEEHEKNN